MKIDIIDLNNTKVGEFTLPESIFGLKLNTTLITQYLRVIRNHLSQGTASAKTRAEVSGGGRKPWKQKGTGRARHGSRRSPIWVHGGVSHGPKEPPYLTMPKTMRRNVLKIILSVRARENRIHVISDFNSLDKPSTKKILFFINALKLSKKTLFITQEKQPILLSSVSNLPGVSATFNGELHAFQILSNNQVIFEKNALEELINRLSGPTLAAAVTVPAKPRVKAVKTESLVKPAPKKSVAKSTTVSQSPKKTKGGIK